MIAHAANAAPAHENLAEAFTPVSDQPDQPIPSSPCGRPRALNLECKKLVVQLLTKGFTLTEAAAFMACDRDTILNERKRDPLFDRNVRRAKAMRNMSPMEVIRQAARTSWRAAAWLIEHRQKAEQEARKIRRQDTSRRAQAFASPSAPEKREAEPAAASFSAPAPACAQISSSSSPAAATESETNKAVTANQDQTVFRRRLRAGRRGLRAGRRGLNRLPARQEAGDQQRAMPTQQVRLPEGDSPRCACESAAAPGSSP